MHIELKTKRLLLRPLNLSDLETVYSYSSDIENTRYMMYLPRAEKEETLSFLTRITHEWQKNEPDFYEFAIVLNGLQIGAVSIYLDKDKSAGELGWILNKHYWHQGYAYEAALAVKDFAIRQLKLHELYAACDERNTASSNIMKKLGMTLVYKDKEHAKQAQYKLTID